MRDSNVTQSKKTRVLIAIHSVHDAGGAERTVANLAAAWSARGWEVGIATMAGHQPEVYTMPFGVHLFALNMAAPSANFLVGLLANLRRIAALRRVIWKFEPDIILGMMSMTNVLVALSAIGTRCRTIGSERIFPPAYPLGRMWEFARRFAYGLLDVVVAQTTETASWLATHTCAKKIEIIPNFVRWPLPSGQPVISPHETIPAGRRVILAVGRLAPQKGFERLLMAFAQFSLTRPSWHLGLIGEGPERSELEKIAEALQISDRVSMPGRAGNLSDWYTRASIFALTSFFEGFPNVLIEAMSYGLPAVSFDCDAGPRDIIRDGCDGILVPVGDVGALADKFALLADDDQLRERMSLAAASVRERFSLQRVIRDWDKAIEATGHEVKNISDGELG